jgi:2-methylisocitrate lyase-like PEP mutase family enzyme
VLSGIPPALGGGVDGGSRRARFRELLSRDEPLLLPGVFDALSGAMAERTGFDSCYLTGAGIANTQLAVPDVGLVTFDAIATQALRLTASTQIPVVVDIDTGFGGPTSVMHTVRILEGLGVSAVQMEDQEMPKRCGHFDRKRVISRSEMQAKVDAAVSARLDDNFVVIARTDALAVEGFDKALDRAKAYRDAGADVIFVEAPVDVEQIERIPQEISDVPLLLNVIPGGRTPELSLDDLGKMGYKVVLHANLLMRAMASAGLAALDALRRSGGSPERDVPFLTWEERQSLVRLQDFDRIEDELFARWSSSAPVVEGG